MHENIVVQFFFLSILYCFRFFKLKKKKKKKKFNLILVSNEMIRDFWIVWPNQDKKLLALYTHIWTYAPDKFLPKISRNIILLLLLKVIAFFGNCSGCSICNPIQKLMKDNIIRTELAHQHQLRKGACFCKFTLVTKTPNMYAVCHNFRI